MDVITGIIRQIFQDFLAVSSQVDPRTILDMSGAEKLTGKGDMLYHPTGEQSPLEYRSAGGRGGNRKGCVFHKSQVEADYNEEVMDAAQRQDDESEDCDALLPDAISLVLDHGQASASLLQRKFKIGYARAAYHRPNG